MIAMCCSSPWSAIPMSVLPFTANRQARGLPSGSVPTHSRPVVGQERQEADVLLPELAESGLVPELSPVVPPEAVGPHPSSILLPLPPPITTLALSHVHTFSYLQSLACTVSGIVLVS